MIFRILLSVLIKLLVDLPMMLLGLLVVGIALPFSKDDQLPWWAWPWGNADHGNDGDSFWIEDKGAGRGWWASYQWLALRNPTFNFSKYKLGLISTGRTVYVGVPAIDAFGRSQIGDKKGPGWSWIRMGWAWEFYFISQPYQLCARAGTWPIPQWLKVRLTARRCLRFRAGWKLFGKRRGEVCQFVFAPNPLMPYSGKLK